MATENDAEVLTLPTGWTQTCFACSKATFGDSGTFCTVFGEVIVSENLAGRDCPAFESSDGRTYVRIED